MGQWIQQLWVEWNGNGPTDIGPLRITTDGTQTGPWLEGAQTPRVVLQAIVDVIATAFNAQIVTWAGADTMAGRKVTGFDAAGLFVSKLFFDWTAGAGPASITYCQFGAALGEVMEHGSFRNLAIGGTDFDSWTSSPNAHILATDTVIYIMEDPERSDTFPDGPGYAIMEWTPEGGEAQTEVFYYAGKTTVEADRRTSYLSGCRRGLFGTTPITAEFEPGLTAAGPTLTSAWGFERDQAAGSNVAYALMQMLTSTGTSPLFGSVAGEFGDFDLAPAYAGLAVDPAAIDAQSFATLDDEAGAERELCLAKPLKFGEFVSQSGVFHGFVFGGRTGLDGRFRLALIPVPLLSAGGLTLELSDAYDGGLVSVFPKLRTARTCINAIRVSTDYDPIADQFVGAPVSLYYANGRTRRPDGETAEIEVPGISGADAFTTARIAADRIFGIWGEQRPVIEFEADRRALMLSAGQLVILTVSGILTPYGARGLTAVPAVVISLQKDWYKPGNESAVKCKAALLAELGPNRGLAPTFNVSVAVTTVTVSAHVYTLRGDTPPWDGYEECSDWMYGPAANEAYVMTFWVEGDYASRVNAEVTYDSDGVWTLGAALGIAPNRAEFAPWGTAGRNVAQAEFVHIADTAEQLGGVDSDFVWTP